MDTTLITELDRYKREPNRGNAFLRSLLYGVVPSGSEAPGDLASISAKHTSNEKVEIQKLLCGIQVAECPESLRSLEDASASRAEECGWRRWTGQYPKG